VPSASRIDYYLGTHQFALFEVFNKSCVEQFKKVIRFCRLQFAAALTPDKQTTRGNWQIELTQIATTLEAHNCQPPVIFLIGTFKRQESYFISQG
jgi:hypothetical protein